MDAAKRRPSGRVLFGVGEELLEPILVQVKHGHDFVPRLVGCLQGFHCGNQLLIGQLLGFGDLLLGQLLGLGDLLLGLLLGLGDLLIED